LNLSSEEKPVSSLCCFQHATCTAYIKEATSYLYFDDMPSSAGAAAGASLGKIEPAVAKKSVEAKKTETPKVEGLYSC
jgi:hypothetical protein